MVGYYLLVALDEAGEADDVFPADFCSHEAVEPADSGRDEFYDIAHIYHREECAGADHIPFPLTEEGIACRYGEHHEQGVDHHFNGREGFAGHTAYGYGNSFARHSDGSAFHLERDADSHHRAS